MKMLDEEMEFFIKKVVNSDCFFSRDHAIFYLFLADETLGMRCCFDKRLNDSERYRFFRDLKGGKEDALRCGYSQEFDGVVSSIKRDYFFCFKRSIKKSRLLRPFSWFFPPFLIFVYYYIKMPLYIFICSCCVLLYLHKYIREILLSIQYQSDLLVRLSNKELISSTLEAFKKSFIEKGWLKSNQRSI